MQTLVAEPSINAAEAQQSRLQAEAIENAFGNE